MIIKMRHLMYLLIKDYLKRGCFPIYSVKIFA